MRACRGRVLVGVLALATLVGVFLVVTSPPPAPATTPSPVISTVMEERRLTLEQGCLAPLAAAAATSASQERGRSPLQVPSSLTVRAMRADSEVQGYKHLADQTSMVGHLIVDDRHQALYCYVPKVACTNWKRLLMILSGTTNETEPLLIPADSVHRPAALTKLDEYAPEEIIHRLQSYKKFLIVRDPLERVLSAFRNKFEKNYASSAYFKKRFGVRIQRMTRTGDDAPNVSSTGEGTTFAEFVSYIVATSKERPEALNEHWAPVAQLCQPCLVRYDYIGKYESLASDSTAILAALHAPSGLALPDAKVSGTDTLLPEYLSELTPTQKLQLQQVFADDIVLFGYTYRDHRSHQTY